MATFELNSILSVLENVDAGIVDYSGKSLKFDKEEDAHKLVNDILACKEMHCLSLRGNTLGVAAAQAIGRALEKHPKLKEALWSDLFTGRMKTEIPPALMALSNGMITAGARLTVLDLSDNAFGPIGVEGLVKLLQSDVCSKLSELRLNNNGLGITGGKLLASALSGGSSPKLRVFIAGRNRLENEGATALAAVFKQMESLQEIAMPQNGIYHRGISALSTAFTHNPQLTTLNLNDNTIGSKGAEAIAGALPSMKKLKCVNFGDCLLKSRGAKTIIKGIKDNSIMLETLDMSHNEIGREVCMEIVNVLASMPDLSKVVLAGNSLGGADKKELMKERLGDCAYLSDGENSEDEYVTGSEESNEEESSCEEVDDDDDEVKVEEVDRHEIILESSNNTSVVEVELDISKFLTEPNLTNFLKLQPKPAQVIDAHLRSIKDQSVFVQMYVDALFKVSSVGRSNELAKETCSSLMRSLVERVRADHGLQWVLTNEILVVLGLIKAETRVKRDVDKNKLNSCYRVLAEEMRKDYFLGSLKSTLQFFVKSKKDLIVNKLCIDAELYEALI